MKKYSGLKVKAIIALIVMCAMLAGSTLAVCAANDGSWSASKARYSFLTSSQKKTFSKAVKGLTGVEYKPVALLAKQTVEGTNYIYLCQGTTVTEKPVKSWYVMSANKDLKKKVSIRSIKKLKVSKIKTNKNPRTETLPGGLEIVGVKYRSKALSPAVRKVFKKAIKKYTGFELRPIALLGTQVVNGKNYRILCYAKNNSTKDLFVVEIYKNSSGKCKLTSCKSLDLEDYVD